MMDTMGVTFEGSGGVVEKLKAVVDFLQVFPIVVCECFCR